jgi:D-sedoheptulose 7-phosphate isomerase
MAVSWSDVLTAHPPLAECEGVVAQAADLLTRALRNGGKLLMCGNGGSASDCEHWAAELLKSYRRQRPVDPSRRLPRGLAEGLCEPIPALPLTSFTAFNTAFSNDCDPELTFAQLVLAFGRGGDVLCAISTSGSSPNVLRAAEVASALGLRVLGITGARGEPLGRLCDVAVKVPATDTGRIQELHLPLYHYLSEVVEAALFAVKGNA